MTRKWGEAWEAVLVGINTTVLARTGQCRLFDA